MQRGALDSPAPSASAATAASSASPPTGQWHLARARRGHALDEAAVAQLRAIGYAGASRPASDHSNVTIHDRARAYPGLNLYTSGHAPEAVLCTMDGRVLHRWSFVYDKAFPGQRLPSTPAGREHWRHVHLLDDGDLLAIYEGQGLIRIDKNSKLRWALALGAHHDLTFAQNGDLYVLTRDVRFDPDVHPIEPILEDFVTVVSPDGAVRRSISLLAAFRNSEFAPMLRKMPPHGDLLHTNSLELVRGAHRRLPAFAPGSLLLSSPHLDAVFILDPQSEKVVWALTGMWHFQHTPTLLKNGNLLVFDNQGLARRSRALEIEPSSQKLVWSYAGTEDRPLFTEFNGGAQRLPNGNTLLVESDGGRALEVTRDGQLVWEFYNPHRAGQDHELIAALFELERLPLGTATKWLGGTR